MMGQNHMLTGACALTHAYVINELINRVDFMPLTIIQQEMQSYLGIAELSIYTVPVFMGAYFFGNLLPDIDNPKTILGRIAHIPIKHRTWIHAIYLYLIIAALGYIHPVFSWLFFGVFVHLFWDSLSACGNCWFYKILSDYITYPNGAVVKKGHKLKLYHAGKWTEYLVAFIDVAVTVMLFMGLRKGI